MIVLNNIFPENQHDAFYVALGSFDGLHKGHMSLIEKIRDDAKNKNGKSMIYTFRSHPLFTINKKLAPKLLMDNDTKIRLLNEQNIDFMELAEFDCDFMQLSPEEFIKKICCSIPIKEIVVGFNYKFGYKNMGDVELLKNLSQKYKFDLVVIPPYKSNGEIISSTFLRNLISEGAVEEANKYLLEPFMIRGKVVSGKGIGRTIGYPTANIEYNDNMLIPDIGVYYTNVRYKERYYKGITSVGFNPTVNGQKLTVETYILNFDKNIYDEYIDVYFIEKTRDERKFSNINGLTAQLDRDKFNAENKKIYIK